MFPSLQVVPFALFTGAGQPVAGTHAPTVWQAPAAAHVIGVPAAQAPAWQVSAPLHMFPSLQVVPFAFAGLEHRPVAPSHVPAL